MQKFLFLPFASSQTQSTSTFKQRLTGFFFLFFVEKKSLFYFHFLRFIFVGRHGISRDTQTQKKHSHSNKTKSFTVFLRLLSFFPLKHQQQYNVFLSHHFSAVTAASASATAVAGGGDTLSIEGGVKKLFVGVGELAPMLKSTCDSIEATP